MEIPNAIECEQAANDLGLTWGGKVGVKGKSNNCFYVAEKSKKVYFNTSPNPTPITKGHLKSLCRNPTSKTI